jgi:lipopolysaccharide transport system ATP-binding protein
MAETKIIAQIADWGKRVLKSEIRHPQSEIDTIWALKDVSFDVQRGQVVGIPSATLRAGIGRNGAGKMTLASTGSAQGSILSRITEPTEGCAETPS